MIYTCPMHPQIRQKASGSCPICGMALGPVTLSAEAQPNYELIDMTRRFWVGLILSLPVFLLEMGSHLPAFALHMLVSTRLSAGIQFVLSTPVVLWAGWPFFERAWASLGEVLEGKSAVDESMVTDESMRAAKLADDALIGGTVNGTGGLHRPRPHA